MRVTLPMPLGERVENVRTTKLAGRKLKYVLVEVPPPDLLVRLRCPCRNLHLFAFLEGNYRIFNDPVSLFWITTPNRLFDAKKDLHAVASAPCQRGKLTSFNFANFSVDRRR